MFFARAYCHRHDELAGFGLADRCQRTCTHVHDVGVDIAVLSVRNVDERLGLRHGCNSNYTQEREHVARRSTPWCFHFSLPELSGLAAFKWFLKRQERRPHPLRTCYRKRSQARSYSLASRFVPCRGPEGPETHPLGPRETPFFVPPFLPPASGKTHIATTKKKAVIMM